MRYVVSFLLVAVSAFAAQSDDQAERLQRVRAEAERRGQIRWQEVVAEGNARRVVREHESGVRKATDEELAAAKEVIRMADQRRGAAREGPASEGPLKANEGTNLHLLSSHMNVVATMWQVYFGETVTVTERANGKVATVIASATSRDEFRKKFVAALRQSGIFVVERVDGVLFDIEPAPASAQK